MIKKLVVLFAVVILLSGCDAMFSKLFKKPKPEPTSEPAQIYADLRDRILKVTPQEIGINQSKEIPNVWGVLMEIGYPEAVVSLVSLADGTTSLYFSNGGGMIGGGEHPAVAQASKALVATAEQYFAHMAVTTTFPLPATGRVKFYILTFSGAFTAESVESELSKANHNLFPLYAHGQEVITQFRLMQEQKK